MVNNVNTKTNTNLTAKEQLQDYLKSHAITQEMISLFSLSFSYNEQKGTATIHIPVFSTTEENLVSFWKHRHFYDTYNEKNPKYTYDKGAKLSLFNGHHLYFDRSTNKGTVNSVFSNDIERVIITEGEIDTIALTGESLGNLRKRIHSQELSQETTSRFLSVSSTGGAGSWDDDWNELFCDKEVLILYDTDEAGAKGVWRVVSSFLASETPLTKLSVLSIRPEIRAKHNIKDVADLIGRGFSLTNAELVRTTIAERGSGDTKKILLADSIMQYYREKKRIGELVLEGYDKVKLKDIEELLFHIRNAIAEIYNLEKEKDGSSRGIKYLVEAWVVECEKELQQVKELSVRVRAYKKNKKNGTLTDTDSIPLEKVRRVPINQFMSFRHDKKAKCLWHNDNVPSLVYNGLTNKQFPNTVKCFACGKFAGVIDVVMKLNNCSFKEAVAIIRNHARL